VRELVPKRRGVGGIVPHADGGWVISGSSLLHIGPDGAQRELLREADACGYNDIFTTADGGLLAGELRYRPLVGEEPRAGRLLLLRPDGEIRVLSEEVLWPNGIGLAPDGRTVYISDYARQLVLAVPIEGGPAREFARVPEGSADGLAVDAEGGVWVALGEAGAIARFDAEGELDAVIAVPAAFVSSISFGGPDRREALISTADNEVSPELGGTLLLARIKLAGLEVTAARV
jgi:gluconolactonase